MVYVVYEEQFIWFIWFMKSGRDVTQKRTFENKRKELLRIREKNFWE